MALKYLVLLLAALLISCGGSSSRPTVELNGDSVMYGQGLDVRPSAYLQELLPEFNIQDKSQVGLTLDSLVKGYSTPWVNGPVPRLGVQPSFNSIERTADIVVISLGGNDAYSNLSPVVFEEQLRGIVQRVKDEGRTPILTGIVQLTPSAVGFDYWTVNRTIELNLITQKIAQDMNVVNANWHTVQYEGLQDTLDGIHRNQKASNLLIEQLALTLRQVLKSSNQ